MHYLSNLSSIIPLPVRHMFRLTLDAKSCNYSQIILSFLSFKTFILSVSQNKERKLTGNIINNIYNEVEKAENNNPYNYIAFYSL